MEPIHMGIVGGGMSARKVHYPKLKDRADQFRVVACCDVDAARSKEVADLYHARPYDNLEAFLKHPGMQLVLVATKPPSTHATVGLAALAAGKDVILEKPMCGTHEEGVRLIAAARKAGRLLAVFQNRRDADWDPDFAAACWAIQQGYFGRLRFFETMICGNLLRSDWLVDWGIHLFDQALVIGGGRCTQVTCAVCCPENPETGSGSWWAALRFDNGCTCVASMRTAVAGNYPRFSIIGDEAACAWPFGSARLDAPSGKLIVQIPLLHRGAEKEARAPETVEIPFVSFYQNLHDVLRNGAELRVKSEEALRAVDVMLAAVESAKTSRTISLA